MSHAYVCTWLYYIHAVWSCQLWAKERERESCLKMRMTDWGGRGKTCNETHTCSYKIRGSGESKGKKKEFAFREMQIYRWNGLKRPGCVVSLECFCVCVFMRFNLNVLEVHLLMMSFGLLQTTQTTRFQFGKSKTVLVLSLSFSLSSSFSNKREQSVLMYLRT